MNINYISTPPPYYVKIKEMMPIHHLHSVSVI